MNDQEKVIVLALGTLLLLLAPGYILHASPRFPGSLAGGALGITAAILFLLVLLYPAIKYIPWVKARVTQHISLGRLLSFHIYGGLLAALFAILHSGHSYRSVLGIALMLDILVVVGTGFVGRYYLSHIAGEVRQRQALLGTLRSAYDRILPRLGPASERSTAVPAVPILGLVDAIADAEYSLTLSEAAKRITGRWMVVHSIASIIFCGLLLLHISSGLYYGLRWLP